VDQVIQDRTINFLFALIVGTSIGGQFKGRTVKCRDIWDDEVAVRFYTSVFIHLNKFAVVKECKGAE
jgi:hypothetical protein